MLKHILIVIFIFLPGCRKSYDYVTGPIGNSIVGKWAFAEYFISPGDAGKWHKAKPRGKVIHFKADGSFASTREELKIFTKYELVSPGKIRLSAANSGDTRLLVFSIDTDNHWLFTYPGDLHCIEGCSDKYRLVK